MLEKILVPLDGSELAGHILPLVRGLALRDASEVVLLRVLAPDEASSTELAREAIARLESARAGLVPHVATVRAEVVTGEPAGAILSFARSWEPTAIALATHARTGFSRLVRGSVTEQLLRNAPAPILAANPLWLRGHAAAGEAPVRNILVPLDGSARSAAVLPLVRELARARGSLITLLHVVEPLAAVPVDLALQLGGTSAFEPQAPVEPEVILEPHARELEREGLRVRMITRFGTPASAICEMATQAFADLVAMATHGRTGIARLFLGSCCEDVLRLAPCPLLVVRTPAVAVAAAA